MIRAIFNDYAEENSLVIKQPMLSNKFKAQEAFIFPTLIYMDLDNICQFKTKPKVDRSSERYHVTFF